MAFNLPREWKPNEWYFTEEFISRMEADGLAKEYGDCGRKLDGAVLRGIGDMTWLQQTGVQRRNRYRYRLSSIVFGFLGFPGGVAPAGFASKSWSDCAPGEVRGGGSIGIVIFLLPQAFRRRGRRLATLCIPEHQTTAQT